MAIVAVASVKITPDLTEFRKQLNAELKALDAKVNVEAQLDFKKAKTELDAWTKKESGKKITKNVDLDFKGATAELATFGASVSSFGSSIQKSTILATAMTSTVQALGPLLVTAAGSAALIPAALVGGIGVLAAFKLGADGIKKSFDALKPTLDTLKSQVSDSFVKSLTPGVKQLAKVLPQLQVGLRSIATAAGGAFTKVANMLNSAGNGAKVNAIFGEMSRVLQNVGGALAPIVQALINIGAIGAPILRDLTAGAGDLAQTFAAWTASAEGAAKIQSVITGSLQAFQSLGQILGQVVGIVTNLFTGISAGAQGLGSSVLPVLTAINEALGSDAGQAALAALGRAISALGSAFASQLGPAIQAVLPYLVQALNFIADHASTIAPLIAGFTLFGGIVAKVAGPIGTLVGVFGKLGPVIKVIFGLLKDNPFLLLAAGIIGALAATGQLTPILNLLGEVLKPILAAVSQLISALLPPLQALFTALTPIFTVVAQVIAQLVTALSPIIGLIAQLIGALLPPLVSLFTSVLTPVLNLAAAFLGPIIQAISAVIGWISNLVGDLGGIKGVLFIVQTAFSVAWNFIKGVWSAVVGWFAGVWNGIVNGVTGALNTVKSWFSSAWNFIKGVWGQVAGFFSNVWSGITNGLKGALNFAIRLLNGAINAINLIPGVNIPHIPMLAEGGQIQAKGTVMVGEAGPELLTLPRGAQVTPLTGRNSATISGGLGGSADPTVNVYVNDEKLKDFIDVRIGEGNRVTKRTVKRGSSR